MLRFSQEGVIPGSGPKPHRRVSWLLLSCEPGASRCRCPQARVSATASPGQTGSRSWAPAFGWHRLALWLRAQDGGCVLARVLVFPLRPEGCAEPSDTSAHKVRAVTSEVCLNPSCPPPQTHSTRASRSALTAHDTVGLPPPQGVY